MGIDGAKAQWDMALHPTGERWAVPTDARGIAPLVDRLQALHSTLRVLEATGGLERAATAAWAVAGLPVVVVTPRHARDGARHRASPRWRAHDDRCQSATGSGPVCARTVRLERPALGTRTRQQIAAVVGVAPLHGDRGTRRGRRTTWGGRAHGRTVFDMGTLVATRSNPQRNAVYERLLAAGHVTHVALTACMHTCLTMLNAMLKHRTPWQPQEVQS